MVNKLKDLLKQSQERYLAMNDSEKLRMWYEQRRSFAKGMCSDSSNYEEHCHIIDSQMPPEWKLTDAQIGLILAGQYHGQ